MPDVLPRELEEFVEREIASGKFRSRAEVIAEAVRLFRERERKSSALREDLRIGIEQLDRGAAVDIRDEASHNEFFDDIEQRGRERQQSRKSDA